MTRTVRVQFGWKVGFSKIGPAHQHCCCHADPIPHWHPRRAILSTPVAEVARTNRPFAAIQQPHPEITHQRLAELDPAVGPGTVDRSGEQGQRARPRQAARTAMIPYPTKITFGEMHASGVRDVPILLPRSPL